MKFNQKIVSRYSWCTLIKYHKRAFIFPKLSKINVCVYAMATPLLLGVIMVSLGVLGLTINSLTIWIFATKKNMISFFHRIFIWLLMENNVYLVCTILSSMYYDFGFKYVIWTLPYFVFPFKDISRTACLLTTICLSYERYVMCKDPGKAKRSSSLTHAKHGKCKVVKEMSCVIIFSFLYNFPRFFAYTLPTNPFEERPQPTNLRNDASFKLYYKGVRWIIFTTISLAILIFLNWEVYRRINNMLKDCNCTSATNEGTPIILEKNNNFGMNVQFLKLVRRREKLVFALFLLVACNLICNSLKVAEETIQAFDLATDGLRELQMFARLMLTINSSVNVLIYYTSDKKFRKYFLSYVKRSIYLVSCKYFFKPEIENAKHKTNESTIPSSLPRRYSKRCSKEFKSTKIQVDYK